MTSGPCGFIVMGVSGCGKSSVGAALAERLGWTFHDADDFHPEANIRKMHAGIPLTDADREPWLENLNAMLSSEIQAGRHPVLACSALKAAYRKTLVRGGLPVVFVYLKGTFEEISARLRARTNHFMPPALLQSQFDTLEEPENAWVCDIHSTVPEIVDSIQSRLN